MRCSYQKRERRHAHMLHGMAAADTIAWVMYQKFCNSLPYTRQEKDWAQYGVAITRATMANWVIRNTLDYFTPMYDYFHRQLLKREFAMADERHFRYYTNPADVHRQNLTCGYSAVGKMEDYQSSFINIQKPVPGITQ